MQPASFDEEGRESADEPPWQAMPLRQVKERIRKRGLPVVSLPSFHSSQAPIPVKNGSPAETLRERELPANGGIKPLLMDLRCTDPMLYEHPLLVWPLTQRLLASLGYPHEEQTCCWSTRSCTPGFMMQRTGYEEAKNHEQDDST